MNDATPQLSGTNASSLVAHLQKLNRKERYWLLRNALGETNLDLQLSVSFRERLSQTIGVDIPVSAWWAMDYHIDWLFTALTLDWLHADHKGNLANPEVVDNAGNISRLIRGTQEDFDLIVAFERTIILIEAKGLTSWGNRQLAKKCRRLQEWSELSEQIAPGSMVQQPMEIFMVLTSPNRPQKLECLNWPRFVKLDRGIPFFLRLDLTAAPALFVVPERCNVDGLPAEKGQFWQLKEASRPNFHDS